MLGSVGVGQKRLPLDEHFQTVADGCDGRFNLVNGIQAAVEALDRGLELLHVRMLLIEPVHTLTEPMEVLAHAVEEPLEVLEDTQRVRRHERPRLHHDGVADSSLAQALCQENIVLVAQA